MKNGGACSTNQVAKWIRVFLSLAIIGLGIYFKNWFGLLGIITLASALTGSCPLSLRLYRPSNFDDNRKNKENRE